MAHGALMRQIHRNCPAEVSFDGTLTGYIAPVKQEASQVGEGGVVFCRDCGAKELEASNFCSECGSPLRELDAPRTRGRQAGPSTLRVLGFVGLGIAGVAALGFVVTQTDYFNATLAAEALEEARPQDKTSQDPGLPATPSDDPVQNSLPDQTDPDPEASQVQPSEPIYLTLPDPEVAEAYEELVIYFDQWRQGQIYESIPNQPGDSPGPFMWSIGHEFDRKLWYFRDALNRHGVPEGSAVKEDALWNVVYSADYLARELDKFGAAVNAKCLPTSSQQAHIACAEEVWDSPLEMHGFYIQENELNVRKSIRVVKDQYDTAVELKETESTSPEPKEVD